MQLQHRNSYRAICPAVTTQYSQRGAAFLLLLLGLSSVALYFLLFTSTSPEKIRTQRAQQTAQALAQAKTVIISWATVSSTHTSAPGLLVCPEDIEEIGIAGKEGESRPSCKNLEPSVGRLPWRTLKMPEILDGDGAHLWYALSPGFRRAPINSESMPGLSIDRARTQAVALIISPGKSLPHQQRQAVIGGRPPGVADFLETENADGDIEFIMLNNSTDRQNNDIVLPISHEALFSQVEARVLSEVEHALWVFFCGKTNVKTGGGCLLNSDADIRNAEGAGYFPYAASMMDDSCLGTDEITAHACQSVENLYSGRLPAHPYTLDDTQIVSWQSVDPESILRGAINDHSQYPDWFQNNGWRELIYYHVDKSCTSQYFNCHGSQELPKLRIQRNQQNTLSEQKVILISAGAPINGQQRDSLAHKKVLENYFEADNLTTLRTGTHDFIGSFAPGVISNDRVLGLK